jgi:hypothetical protein
MTKRTNDLFITVVLMAATAGVAHATPPPERADPTAGSTYGSEPPAMSRYGDSTETPSAATTSTTPGNAPTDTTWVPMESEVASPEDGSVDDPDNHQPLDDRDLADWDHFEISMGFVGGWRRFDRMSFRGDSELDPTLWRAPPFDGVPAYGLRYDARLVVAYTRMTMGVDIPFASYAVDETAITMADGSQSTVADLRPWSLRFGIGAELPVGPVAPFIDVLGSIHTVKATFDIDDIEREVTARGFGFSVRAGIRLHVRRWFFAQIAGEAGIVGSMVWAGDLSVGFAVM